MWSYFLCDKQRKVVVIFVVMGGSGGGDDERTLASGQLFFNKLRG